MISVLMPIYNGIEFIEESITSVQRQTFPDWQILIGINGHPANSEVYQIASKYASKQIKVFDFPEIKGKPTALNELLKFSTDICCLLDVDDKWLPMKLQKQVPLIGEYDVVGTMYRYFGDRDDAPAIPLGKIDRLVFNSVNPIINSSSMFKKQDAYWDKKIFGAEDYDLWMRLNHGGKTFFNISDTLVLHRIHKASCFNTHDVSKTVDDIRKRWRVE